MSDNNKECNDCRRGSEIRVLKDEVERLRRYEDMCCSLAREFKCELISEGVPVALKHIKMLETAIYDYVESPSVNADSSLRQVYVTLTDASPGDIRLRRATRALKKEMMRSHMGEDVSYEQMA